MADRASPDLVIELSSPEYGEFMGDQAVNVQGTVYPPQAQVWIEGESVEVTDEGSFELEVPVDYAYLIVDAEASVDNQYARLRIPVFAGMINLDLADGMTGRLLPAGLEILGQQIGSTIDATGWVTPPIRCCRWIQERSS